MDFKPDAYKARSNMAYWIFKYKPEIYDFEAQEPRTWNVPQHREKINAGDIAFLWRTGEARGIRGAMRIDTEPQKVAEPESEIEQYQDGQSKEGQRIIKQEWRVSGTVICRGANLAMSELRKLPGLESLSALKRGVRATVFEVTAEEGEIISGLIGI